MLRLPEGCHRLVENDAVILYEGYSSKKHVNLKQGYTFGSAGYSWTHSDIIGKPFGTPIPPRNVNKKSRKPTVPYVYALKPTTELWTNCLNHRTQIIFTPDIAMICLQLQLQPGSIVVEAGTGSGSLSSSIARYIAPTGHLYSYDFHASRPATAQKEFEENGIGHLTTVTCRDACGVPDPDAAPLPEPLAPQPAVRRSAPRAPGALPSTAPFAVGPAPDLGLPPRSVDAVFFDLPAPYNAIPGAAALLKPNGRICTFSPCIEQVQKSCSALRRLGFVQVRTIEVLQRTYEMRPEGFESFECHNDIISHQQRDAAAAAAAADTAQEVARDQSVDDEPKAKRRKTEREDEDGEDEEGDGPPDGCYMARPRNRQRGHTGYLTFATLMPTTANTTK